MCITMAFILLAQGPNLYFNLVMRFNSPSGATTEERQKERSAHNATNRKNLENLVAAQKFIPPFWVSVGAKNLAEGNALPALLGTLGCVAIGALGLRRAYISTVRFYHGETGGNAPVKTNNPGEPRKNSAPRDKTKVDFLERSLPFVPEQSAALALSTFRSLLRAPEVKMAWATTIIVTVILGISIFSRGGGRFAVPEVAKSFVATGSVIFSVFFLIQFFTNFFGFDRDGFRALILSPADRRFILLGKNLAVLPIGIIFGGLFFTLVAIRLHPPVETIFATLLQLGSVLLIAGIGGNLLSILAPYRIQPGSMKPTKMPGLATIVLVISQMLFPTVMLPVFFGPLLELLWRHWNLPAFVPINLVFSAAFFFFTAFIYWIALRQLGSLLQRRETKILRVITVEVE
jgi:ABC-2 type transport system permease protein